MAGVSFQWQDLHELSTRSAGGHVLVAERGAVNQGTQVHAQSSLIYKDQQHLHFMEKPPHALHAKHTDGHSAGRRELHRG